MGSAGNNHDLMDISVVGAAVRGACNLVQRPRREVNIRWMNINRCMGGNNLDDERWHGELAERRL